MTRARTSLVRGGRGPTELPSALLELCQARLDSVSFRRELRARLLSVLSFDAYCVNTVDPETRVITSSIGDGLSTSAARRLFEIEETGRDFNQLAQLARGPEHVATLWRATDGQVARSTRMRVLFMPLGFGDELRAALAVDGSCWGYLHLFRSAERAPFADRDVARIQLLRPLLAGALRAACLVGEEAMPARAPGVLMLDGSGEIVGENTAARSWLEACASDVGGAVPHAVHVLGARLRSSSVATPTARYKTPAGAWLALHASRVDRGMALLLGTAHPSQLASLLFLAHGLTPREREVSALLLRGLGNDAIAASLGIALYTAKDYVKVILEKTGAPNRASFAAKYAT
ncbi:MAG TPA: helix-turn-helix transcriptional regulator [Polyangiaceae bacterium]|nr:helix-turn-helix transcriptional regulator [Polyangiaceae bacterium]